MFIFILMGGSKIFKWGGGGGGGTKDPLLFYFSPMIYLKLLTPPPANLSYNYLHIDAPAEDTHADQTEETSAGM